MSLARADSVQTCWVTDKPYVNVVKMGVTVGGLRLAALAYVD